MKLSFHQTSEDYKDLWKNSFQQKRGIFLIIMLIMIILFGGLLKISIDRWSGNSLVSYGIISLLFIGVWMIQRKRIENPKGDRRPFLIGSREIEFLEEGINYKTEVSKTFFQWEAVTQFSESSKSYFLYLGKQRAIIIPKSALKTAAEQKSFLDMIKRKLILDIKNIFS